MSYATDIAAAKSSPFAYRPSLGQAPRPEPHVRYALCFTYTRPTIGSTGTKVFGGPFLNEGTAKFAVDLLLDSLRPRAHQLIKQIEVLALVEDHDPVTLVSYFPSLKDGHVEQSFDHAGEFLALLEAFDDLRVFYPEGSGTLTSAPKSSDCGFALPVAA